MGGKEEVARHYGEGENNVRNGEGEVTKGRGRRGEGEKNVRFGQVEMKVQENGGG